MKKEREIQLREAHDNKGNGFYERNLSSAMGKLELSVPRDRNGCFRPFILPKEWKRTENSYNQLLTSLVLNAYSPNKIKAVLKELNLPYSQDELEELKNELYERSKTFKTRQLPDKAFCIFIDAYHTDMKDDNGQVRKAALYTVIGIDMDGKKEVYGYYEVFGSENKGEWLAIFNDLIKRGLKRFLLIVSDDFPGISDSIQSLFPKADHQLCFVHLLRNVRKNMGRPDYKVMKDGLVAISKVQSFEKAVSKFTELCGRFKSRYPAFIEYILKNKERYFNFLKYPGDTKKHIYTTNVVENINSRLEVVRCNNGGYFQSIKTLMIATFVLIENISKNYWRKSLPAFKANEYEIHQMFNLRYPSQTQFS